MRNMPSPMLGGPPASCLSRKKTRWEESGLDEGPFLSSPGRTITYAATLTDQEDREAERGPWARMPVQDSGPLVRPEQWDRLREAAEAGGYKQGSCPAGLRPG